MPLIGAISTSGSQSRVGLSLTQRTLPVTFALSNFQKGGNGNKWLVGSNGSTSIATSSDGITWTTTTINAALKNRLSARYNAAGPQGEYVTLDNNTTVNYSSAGTTWSSSTANYSGSMTALKHTPVTAHMRKFSDSSIETSPTGVTWTIRTGGLYGAYDIAFSSTHTGYPTYYQPYWIYTTSATWATFSQATLPATKGWIGAAYDSTNGRFVVYDDTGVGAYSSNGTSWTQITLPTLSGYSYAGSNDGGGGVYVFGGNNGYLFSKNGINFNRQNLPSGTYLAQYDAANNYYLILKSGDTTYYTGTIPA